MQLYKLTDNKGQTKNSTQWGNGVTHQLDKKQNPQLCTGDVFHAYKNINLAYLLNPIHANYTNPIRVAFAVLCAESVLAIYEDKYPNDSRVSNAIKAAKEYLFNPSAYAARAARAAAFAAAYAANAAAYAAADAAAHSARAANAAAYAAYAAAFAAFAAAFADDAAAYAARAARAAAFAADGKIDFCLLANTAVELTERSNSNGT
jgi:hypothetical protein